MDTIQQELLSVVSATLFHTPDTRPEITPELLREAELQTVYPLLKLPRDGKTFSILKRNSRNYADHRELHRLMTENGIPYVVLKGQASARYYPEPVLRMAGDVDFLVAEGELPKARDVLLSAGFTGGRDDGGQHIAFFRKPHSHWELHRLVPGVTGASGEYLKGVIAGAREADGMMVPSDFHHGLILLCHTASHLTHEGVGLRHLCDWAVFIDRADASPWERELRRCGLWKLARMLSLVSERYLGIEHRAWFGGDEDGIVPELMEDILTCGNFGARDGDRYRQIKYVAGHTDSRASDTGSLRHAWDALNRKAAHQKKTRAAVLKDYASMLLSGERRPDTPKTLSSAAHRRELYRKLRLYENEE